MAADLTLDRAMLLFPLLGQTSLSDYIDVKLDSSVYSFLKGAMYFIVEAGESVERLLKREEIVPLGRLEGP